MTVFEDALLQVLERIAEALEKINRCVNEQ